ncbi:MAG: HD domain-containing phosphohydrolase, partial [Chloroflexota bacterium]
KEKAKKNLAGTLSSGEEITELKQEITKSQRLLEQQIAVNQLVLALGEMRKLEDIYQVIYNHTMNLMDVIIFIIFFYDHDTQLIRAGCVIHEGSEIDVSNYPSISLQEVGYRILGQVIHTGKSIYNPGYQKAVEKTKTKYTIDEKEEISKILQPIDLLEESTNSVILAPMKYEGQVFGVLQVQSYRLDAFKQEDIELLSALAAVAAITIQNARLINEAQRSAGRLAVAYDATIEVWARALTLRDKEAEGSLQRVTEMTLRLARKMGVSDSEIEHMRRGALLHDVGKMGISDSILLKPGQLTEQEWQLMRRHPDFAYELLSSIAFLLPALDIPYCHHEKWDGSGYPRGLKGEDIPLAARIFAVVDVWDALLSDRPYRPAFSKDRALKYIKDQPGKHFDPQVVKAFLDMVTTSLNN